MCSSKRNDGNHNDKTQLNFIRLNFRVLSNQWSTSNVGAYPVGHIINESLGVRMKRHERIKRSMTKRKISYLVALTPIKTTWQPEVGVHLFQKPITWWDIHFGTSSINQKPIFSTRVGGTYYLHSRQPIRGRGAWGHFSQCWWNVHTIRSTSQKRRFYQWQLFVACRCFKNM